MSPSKNLRRRFMGSLFVGMLLCSAPALASTNSGPIKITPDGMEIWNVNPDHNTVSVTGTQGVNENTLITEINVLRDPWTLDIHPSNGQVWVTSKRDDAIVVIDGPSRAVIDTITGVGFGTFGICFSPDGLLAAVTASGSDEVFLVDVATRNVTDTFSVDRRPHGIAWYTDNTRFYVSHLLFEETTSSAPMTKFSSSGGWSEETVIRIDQDANIFDHGGYPSGMMSIIIQPAPADTVLVIPCTYINTLDGGLVGGSIEFDEITQSGIRPVDLINDQSGFPEAQATIVLTADHTPVSGTTAIDFKSGKMYIANLSSGDITIMSGNVYAATEDSVMRCGEGPLGVVAHPTLDRVYIFNWLSREISVINSLVDTMVAMVPNTTFEPLSTNLLNGKQMFFGSRDSLSTQNRHSCHSCHVFGTSDSRAWDFTTLGSHKRSTPDIRHLNVTGPQNWTASMDENQDHEFGIMDLQFGNGLIVGAPNPKLGPTNAGLSQDLDDLALFMSSLLHRPDTPYQAAGGGLTANAQLGKAIFEDPTVGCVNCHAPPFFTDSNLSNNPYILHDVGTADTVSAIWDTTGMAGYDTPTLIGVWDSSPYMHNGQFPMIRDIFEFGNTTDLHGVTSGLSTTDLDNLQEYVLSIGAPLGAPTDVINPTTTPMATSDVKLAHAGANPFAAETSLRFFIDEGPARVQIELFNLAGRRVRTLLNHTMTRGNHTIGWDSRDEQGRAVADGIYFARLVVNGEKRSTAKMTVLR